MPGTFLDSGLRRSMPIVRQGPGLCQTQDLSRHTTDDPRKASISIDFKIFQVWFLKLLYQQDCMPQ